MAVRGLSLASRVALLLLAIWLLLGPYMFHFGTVESRANSNILGFLALILGIYRLVATSAEHLTIETRWANWVQVILGVWLIASPFVYGYSGETGPLLNDIIVGIIAILLALYSVTAPHARPSEEPAHH